MSTVVVVKKDGHIVIAADTLTTVGSTKQHAKYVANDSKIITVGSSFLGFVGFGSWDLIFKHYFDKRGSYPALDSVHDIYETSLDFHRELKSGYFLNPKEDDDDPFESTQLECLIANPSGIYGLFSLRSVQEYTRFFAFGSGATYALGAMHALYESDSNAEKIARAGIEAAADFDDATSLPIELHSVAK